MSKPAWQHIAWIIGALLAAAAVGALLDLALLFVAVTLAIIVAYHVRNLIRFEHWLRYRSEETPPNMDGLWGEVLAITHRLYRRKVFHKRRVTSLLREFRRMTSAMPDGAVLLGPNREILWFNRTAGHWLDLRRKVDYGIRIDNLVRNPDFVEYLDKRGAMAPPRIHLPKQGDRWLLFRLVTASDTGQQLLIIRDVTSEARLESMRKDFVANASHELRSPLTVIGGYLDALADEPGLDPAWQQPVQEMRRQSDRMRGIVQDLLELSRLEAQGGAAELAPVDVGGHAGPDPQGRAGAARASVLGRAAPRQRRAAARLGNGAALDLLEPRVERGEVHAGNWPRRYPLVDGPGGWPRRGARYRRRHPSRAPATVDGALLPGRCRPLSQDGRLWARAGDREARVTASWRPARRAERRGTGQYFFLSFSTRASGVA